MPANSLVEFWYNGADSKRILYLPDPRTVVNVIQGSYLADIDIEAEKVKWVFLYRVIEKDMEVKLYTLISKETKDLLLKASLAANDGINLMRNDPDNAIKLLIEAVDLFGRAGGYEVKGDILNDTGLAYSWINMYNEALNYFKLSLEIFENRDPERYVNVLINRASLYEGNNESIKAIGDLNYAEWTANKNNFIRQQVLILNNSGYILFCNQKFDDALEKYKQVLSIKSKINCSRKSIAQTWFNIAIVYERVSQIREAINAYRNCLELLDFKFDDKKPAEARLYYSINKHISFLERKLNNR